MTQTMSEPRAIAPSGITHTTFVRYIDRTREYYAAQGFERPYRWACYEDVPFTPLAKPLAESVVAVITTANEPPPPGWKPGDERPLRHVHSFPSDAIPELYTQDLSWHKLATHTDDVDSYVPIRRLAELASEGRIGAVAPRGHGVPTEYSQRRTLESDAPEVLHRVRADGADVAFLVPL